MDSLEHEVRLGIRGGKSFNPNIGKMAFDKMLGLLASSKHFEPSKFEDTDSYISDDVRFSSRNQALEQKTRLTQTDTAMGMFVLRFCIAREQKLKGGIGGRVVKHTRQKVRHRFSNGLLHIDLTHVKNTDSYEVEIEAEKTYASTHSSEHVQHYLEAEMRNLVSCANL